MQALGFQYRTLSPVKKRKKDEVFTRLLQDGVEMFLSIATSHDGAVIQF